MYKESRLGNVRAKEVRKHRFLNPKEAYIFTTLKSVVTAISSSVGQADRFVHVAPRSLCPVPNRPLRHQKSDWKYWEPPPLQT